MMSALILFIIACTASFAIRNKESIKEQILPLLIQHNEKLNSTLKNHIVIKQTNDSEQQSQTSDAYPTKILNNISTIT